MFLCVVGGGGGGGVISPFANRFVICYFSFLDLSFDYDRVIYSDVDCRCCGPCYVSNEYNLRS